MAAPMISKRHPLGPRVTVKLTAEIINTAVRNNSSHCMIAEAIKAAVPTASRVSVDISTCRFSDLAKGYRYVYLTPRAAQDSLVDFDEGLKPEPFTFQLKNAQVTRAGDKRPKDPMKAKAAKERETKARQDMRRRSLLKPGEMSSVPRDFGGRRPPQLHIRREFGLRAFRAASLRRLAADLPNASEAQDQDPQA